MSNIETLLASLSPEKRRLLEIKLKKEGRIGNASFLSYAQQRLWLLYQLEPENTAYNIPTAVRLKGRLNRTALEQALNEIARRHEILRTTFTTLNGTPLQVVAPEAKLPLQFIDLSSEPQDERDEKLRQLLIKNSRFVFNLNKGPLIHVFLYKLADDNHVFQINMHHIISDGWSVRVFINEFTVLYSSFLNNRKSPLPDLRIQYADFARWQRKRLEGETRVEQLNYWKKKLGGSLPVLELPTDHPRPPVKSYRGRIAVRDIAGDLVQKIQRISLEHKTTSFMTLLAAFYALLYRYSGQDDICVGTPIANRNRAETEGLIGFFVNTLVLRADLSGEPTFQELLNRTKELALEAFSNQDLPFEMLVEELNPERSLSHTPLFQVMFVYQKSESGALKLPGLEVEGIELEGNTAKFDITLTVSELPDKLLLSIEYDSDLFEARSIDRMLEHYQILLESALEHPDVTISRLEMLSPQERKLLLEEWPSFDTQFAPEKCVHHVFEQQVQRFKDRVAIEYEDQRISYEELNQKANQLAHYLLKRGVKPDDLIALYSDRLPHLPVAILGILKAGAAYLPMDPVYPAERIAFMLEDAGADLILTQSDLQGNLPTERHQTICLDSDWPEISKEPVDNPQTGVAAHNLIYVIYTSGSTGKPKGTLLTHHNVLRLFQATDHWFGFNENDVWSLFFSYAFDFSVWEIWGALLYGGRLVVVPQMVSRSPEDFYRLLIEKRVTVLNQTPSAFRQLIQAEEKIGRPPYKTDLRYIIFGGEALELNTLRPWFDRHDDQQPQLINMYGITETTVHVTYRPIRLKDVQANRGSVIGNAIPDLQVYILDKYLQPTPIGVPGEICVSGDGLARGYLNREELTSSKFVPNPFTKKEGSRLYRSGDLARYLPDGDIEYIGRIDNQIKIRGFRVELGEIEMLLHQHAKVREALVITAKDSQGDDIIVAYLIARDNEELTTQELKEYLRSQLPEYMVPSAFVVMDEFPLTPNGKIDRRALPDPAEHRIDLKREYIAPRNATEETLSEIFSELLNISKVGATDHFFELGGHSLLATQLLSRIRDHFKTELSLKTLFENPTVEELALAVETALQNKTGVDSAPIVPVSRDQKLPLSFAQQRLWFLDQMDPGNPMYNIPSAIRLQGELNLDALKATLNTIVERHENLRTAIETVEGEPQLKIYEHVDLDIPITDISHLSSKEREAEARRLAMEEAARPFALDKAPLLRASLIKLSKQEHIFLITFHHIISDGWSTGVLVREFVPLYSAYVQNQPFQLPPLELQYADFAYWQRNWLTGKVLEEQVDFWRKTLEGAPPYLELPVDHPRPAQMTSNGARMGFDIDKELSAAVKALTRQEGVSLFMTLLAAYQTLLYRYSGQDDILVGTPIAGRNRKEIEPLIGFFVNTLVMRTDLSGNPGFRELLTRVRKVALDAFAHQDLPFEKLLDLLNIKRDVSRPPLFQTMFALQNIPRSKVELPGLTLSEMAPDNPTAKFEITMEMTELHDGTLAGVIEYNTDLFERETIGRLISHFKRLLRQIVKHPDQPVSGIRFISEEEERQLIHGWNDTKADFPLDVPAFKLFEQQAEKTPDAIAVRFDGESLTYRELNTRANQLARYLLTQGFGPEQVAAVALERSFDLLVSVLAVMKSGGAYVGLDPSLPAERIEYICQDSAAAFILTHSALAERFTTAKTQLIELDTRQDEIRQAGDANPDVDLHPENLAYIIYTSGSTGQPKGTLIEHRSLSNYLHWVNNSPLGQKGQILPQITKLSFDAALKQLIAPLLRGDYVWLVPDAYLQQPAILLQKMSGLGAVHLNCVPTLWQAILDAGENMPDQSWRDSLSMISLGGEAINPELINRTQQKLPHVTINNVYGPSETTANASYATLESPEEITIGRPIANTRLYVLDSMLQPVPVGIPGQLFIAGISLSRGYLHRPDLTAETFIPDPFAQEPGARMYKTGDLVRYKPNGNIEFLGRIDHQVKIRGFRVELGEIEAALTRHELVKECVVIARKDTPGITRLVAYIVTGEEKKPSVSELRDFLKERLPEYMIPSFFVTLDALPVTSTGKLDRRALPEPDDLRPELSAKFVAPSSENEKILAEIWQNLLGLKQVGVNDNFFELGGDSILSIQVIAHARQHGLQITPIQIFKHQTIAELAAIASSAPVIEAEQGPVTGPVPLTPIQQRFFEKQFPNPHHWNQSLMLEVKEKLDNAILRKVVAKLLEHHDALRLRFMAENDHWRQENAGPDDNIPFETIDLSGLSADKQKEAISEKAAAFQRSLDLSKGPVVRIVYFQLGENSTDRILIIVHHLAMDGVSWRILLEDILAAYQQLTRQPEAQLPPKTTSFKHWAEKLSEYAASEKLAAEKEYWLNMTTRPTASLPVDIPGGKNDEQNVGGVVESLSEEETKALLQDVPPVYNTQINDILLTALVRAFSRWNGKRSLLINLEGHGREDLFDDVDISRTIGWFTAVYPVLLNLENAVTPGDTIKTIKEQLRQIPNKGIGFGLLRYLSGDDALRQALQKLEQGAVTFNYLGQFDQALPENSPFAPAAEDKGPDHDPRCLRDSLISVSGSIAGNRLHMHFSFSRNLYHESTIRQVAAFYIEELRGLIAHCKSPEAGGRTASDFELAKLDNKKLDKVMAQLGKKKRKRK